MIFLDFMLKKNVFLRTTKFKANPLYIQKNNKSNAKTDSQKEVNQIHIEESLLSNHSSSTRTGSREKILSKNINTTFVLSESQTSNTNKNNKHIDLYEQGTYEENKKKSQSNEKK